MNSSHESNDKKSGAATFIAVVGLGLLTWFVQNKVSKDPKRKSILETSLDTSFDTSSDPTTSYVSVPSPS